MDFADLGKHCHFCKQQDYLPIKCSNCGNHFCSAHARDHNCPCTVDNIKKFIDKKNKSTTRYRCTYEHCKKKKVSIDISCKLCKKRMCIPHRFPETHECVIYRKNMEFRKKKILENKLMIQEQKDKEYQELKRSSTDKNKPKKESVLASLNKENQKRNEIQQCCNIS